MTSVVHEAKPIIFNRVIEFLIFALIFFISCRLLGLDVISGGFAQALIYATVMVLFVHLARGTISASGDSFRNITWRILGNAAGIVAGTITVTFIEVFVLAEREILVAVLFSSVMAFFVLGTISPIVSKRPPVAR